MAKLSLDVQKCKAGSVVGLQRHDQREGQNHSNKDIDPERTKLNYDLHNPEKISFTQKIKSRIAEEGIEKKRAIRSDANVMLSIVIQAKKDFFDDLGPEKTKDFFKAAYDVLAQKYGEKNIISANVHMDEKAPHLHFKFVPIVEKNNEVKLRGGELINRPHLIELHTIVAEHLQQHGFDIQRGESELVPREHLTVQQFKAKEFLKTESELELREFVIEAQQSDIKIKSEELAKKTQELAKTESGIESKLTELKTQEKALAAQEQDIAKRSAAADQRLAQLSTPSELLQISGRCIKQEPMFGKTHIDISIPDFNKLYNMASVTAKALEQLQPLQERVAKIPALEKESGVLRSKNLELTKSNKDLNKDLSKSQEALYKQYRGRGLDDTQTAAVMMNKGISKAQTAQTIGNCSPSSPNMSNEARDFANGIIAAALRMDSPTVALTCTMAGEDGPELDDCTPEEAHARIATWKEDHGMER